jgi:serine/threonine protein kinase
MVMDLIPGINLYEFMQAAPPDSDLRPPSLVREILAQVTRHLVVLHGRGILHRDLKPENVMLACPDWKISQGPATHDDMAGDGDDSVYRVAWKAPAAGKEGCPSGLSVFLIDMGLATVMPSGAGRLRETVVGSPHFLPPEIRRRTVAYAEQRERTSLSRRDLESARSALQSAQDDPDSPPEQVQALEEAVKRAESSLVPTPTPPTVVYDHGTDIWSLGLLALEWTVGTTAFRADDYTPSYVPDPARDPLLDAFMKASLDPDPKRRASSLQLSELPYINGVAPRQENKPSCKRVAKQTQGETLNLGHVVPPMITSS